MCVICKDRDCSGCCPECGGYYCRGCEPKEVDVDIDEPTTADDIADYVYSGKEQEQ